MKRVLLIIAAAVLAYLPGLQAGWHYDDRPGILMSPLAGSLKTAWTSFLHGENRSLATLTLALNGRAGTEVLGYHAVNVAVHAANACLVFSLAAALGMGAPAALAAGFLFALHPLQVQAITYVVQRSAALAALFHLGGALAYLAWRARAPGRASAVALLGLGLCAVAAALSKETAITMPLTLGVLEVLLPSSPRRRGASRLAGLLAVSAGVSLLPLGQWLGTQGVVTLEARTEATGILPLEYLRQQLQVHLTYLRLLFLPFHQSLIHPWVRAGAWVEAPSAGLLAALCAWACLSGRAPAPVRAGVLWWFAAHALESSVLPIEHPIFEHRCYLPMAGAALAAAPLAARLGTGGLPVLACLAALTMARQSAWRDDDSLVRNVMRVAPRHTSSNSLAGERFLTQGRPELTHPWFARSLRCRPMGTSQRVRILANDAHAWITEGRPERALPVFERALRNDPNRKSLHAGLGRALLALGRFEEAQAELVLGNLGEDRLSREMLAVLRWRGLGRAAVLRALSTFARDPSAGKHLALGQALLAAGALQEAVDFLELGILRNPHSPDLLETFALSLAAAGVMEEARDVFELGVKRFPARASLWNNLGTARARGGDRAGAVEAYRRALEADAGYGQAQENLRVLEEGS